MNGCLDECVHHIKASLNLVVRHMIALALYYTTDLKWGRPSIASLNTVQALSRDSTDCRKICVLEESPLLKNLIQALMEMFGDFYHLIVSEIDMQKDCLPRISR